MGKSSANISGVIMAKKKEQPKTIEPRISLGEFSNIEGIKETLVAGFKVWLNNDLHSRTKKDWNKLLTNYLKS